MMVRMSYAATLYRPRSMVGNGVFEVVHGFLVAAVTWLGRQMLKLRDEVAELRGRVDERNRDER